MPPRKSPEMWANVERVNRQGEPQGPSSQFDVDGALFLLGEDFGFTALRHLEEWQDACEAAGQDIEPGRYRITVYAQYSGTEVGAFTFPVPVPDVVRKLDFDKRRFLVRQLGVGGAYRGVAPDTFAEHIDSFGQHIRGEITDTQLTARTGVDLTLRETS